MECGFESDVGWQYFRTLVKADCVVVGCFGGGPYVAFGRLEYEAGAWTELVD